MRTEWMRTVAIVLCASTLSSWVVATTITSSRAGSPASVAPGGERGARADPELCALLRWCWNEPHHAALEVYFTNGYALYSTCQPPQ